MTSDLLTEKELAERWKIKPETLRNWRAQKKGIPYFGLMGDIKPRIRYRIQDIEKYESENVINPSSEA